MDDLREGEKRRHEKKKDHQSFGRTLFPFTIKYLIGRFRDHMEMISLSLTSAVWEVH